MTDNKQYRVTLVVDMDVYAEDADSAFDYVHHEATKNAGFTVIESYDPQPLNILPTTSLRKRRQYGGFWIGFLIGIAVTSIFVIVSELGAAGV